MTNEKIIYDAAIAAKLYTEDEAAAILMKAGTLPLHTFPEWKRLGYSVKKGEKAAVAVHLWKYTTKPSKAAIEKAEKAGKDVDALEADPHYYKKLSYLFTDKQVKPTGAPDEEPESKPQEAAPVQIELDAEHGGLV